MTRRSTVATPAPAPSSPRARALVILAVSLATGACRDSASDGGDTHTETGTSDDADDETSSETGGGPHMGDSLWTRTHDGPAGGFDAGYGVSADTHGNVIVVGMHEDLPEAGGRNIWIRKYAANGDELWTETVDGPAAGDDFAFGVVTDASDDLVVVGGWATPEDDRNIWLRKYSKDGEVAWTRAEDGPAGAFDNANGIDVDVNGDVIIAGRWTDAGDNVNVWLRKYAANGDVVWTRTHDGPDHGFDASVDLTVLPDSSFAVVGRQTASGNSDIWVRRYDAGGTELWTQTYDHGIGDDIGTGAAVDSNGDIWISGRVTVALDDEDIWVRKYAPDGTELWTLTHAGPSNSIDVVHGVDTDESGNAYVVGRETDLANGGENIWIRKYSSSGEELWTNVHDGPAGASDIASEVSVDFNGNVFVVGQSTALDDDGGVNVWVSKYSPWG